MTLARSPPLTLESTMVQPARLFTDEAIQWLQSCSSSQPRQTYLQHQLIHLDSRILADIASATHSLLCRDIITPLPPELSACILGMLDLPDLVNCMQVSKAWRSVADNPDVWRNIIRRLPGLSIDPILLEHYQNVIQRHKKLGGSADMANVTDVPDVIDWKLMCRAHVTATRALTQGKTQPRTELAMVSSNNMRIFEIAVSPGKSSRQMLYPVNPNMLNNVDMYNVAGVEIPSAFVAQVVHPVFACSRSGQIIEFDLDSGRLLGMLKYHSSTVTCIDLYEHTLVSGSTDHSVVIWDLNRFKYSYFNPTNEPTLGTRASLSSLSSSAAAPSSSEINAAFRYYERKQAILGLPNAVRSVRVNSRYLVVGMDMLAIHIYDVHTGEQLHIMAGHRKAVNDMILVDQYLFSAGADGDIMWWCMDSFAKLNELRGHRNKVASLAVVFPKQRSQLTATATATHRAHTSGGYEDGFGYGDDGHDNPDYDGDGDDDDDDKFYCDGKLDENGECACFGWVASGSKDDFDGVRIWKVYPHKLRSDPQLWYLFQDGGSDYLPQAFELQRTLHGIHGKHAAIVLRPDLDMVIAGGHDSMVIAWRLSSGVRLWSRVLYERHMNVGITVTSMALAGTRLVCSMSNGDVQILDFSDNTLPNIFR
ncbi:WD40 repeat-like protein [Ramicandelaber brevisporus]|nr:WD40 repeat-like protein [Ramicandelaber brevisporus]